MNAAHGSAIVATLAAERLTPEQCEHLERTCLLANASEFEIGTTRRRIIYTRGRVRIEERGVTVFPCCRKCGLVSPTARVRARDGQRLCVRCDERATAAAVTRPDRKAARSRSRKPR